jgi:origin recognition complex subunit 6
MEGLDVQASRMKGMREKGMHAVKAFCEDKRRVLPEELTGGRLEGVLESSVTFYMLEAEDCGWLEMEWFGNVPVREEGLDPEGEVGGEIDEDDEGEEMGPVTPRKRPAPTPLRRKEKRGGKRADDGWEDEVGAAGLLPGLGTMFQPAIDWLSDERRAEYAQWKKGIMREIAVIEQKV